MSNTIIQVENLGKKYLIKHQQQGNYTALRDVITDKVKSFGKKIISPWNHKQSSTHSTTEEFWALKDISFKVKQGEVVGIIGRNGAGKTTLLKILSRITEPTTGRIRIKGRVASLLEVGTGFHPELTGRENIFLNGAILGMTRREIRKKFDEIVAFAEIETFLDTPVKRYSSGMYVRLAFAVAAHLDPDILVIDEVLAVGDAAFQKKCLGKMGDVAREGLTVLFVSHNMGAVQQLCNRCCLLEGGKLKQVGEIKQIIDLYCSNEGADRGEVDFTKKEFVPGDSEAKLLKARILNSKDEKTSEVMINENIVVEMEYQLLNDNMAVTPNFHIYDSEGKCIFLTSDAPLDPRAELKLNRGVYLAKCHIPENFLNDGIYYVGFALSTMFKVKSHFFEKDLLRLSVVDRIDGVITRGMYAGPMPGTVRPALQWESRRLQ